MSRQELAEMISAFNYEVLFEVKVKVQPGETVCVTGDSEELGKWNPHKAIKLQMKSKSKGLEAKSQGNEAVDDSKGELWSKKLKVSSQITLKYRYFTCRVFQTDHEDEEESVIVTRWETNRKPRVFSLEDSLKTKSEEEAIFGYYGGHCSIMPGWLTDQTQVTINLHQNPIKMWNNKSRDQLYRIKCTPLDHKYREESKEEDGEHLPVAANTTTAVVILEKNNSIPHKQEEFGSLYKPNGFLCFMVQTMDPETTGYQLDFYTHTEEPETPVHIGYSFILPFDLNKSRDFKTLPITSLKHKPLGQITIDYLMVKPLNVQRFNMEACYQKWWNPTRKPLDIAHRGMGVSYSDNVYKTLSTITENTVQSMKDAFEHGADFVELDVHLTKDKEVIVYHDFKVYITYRKKRHGEHELLSIPVKDLLLTELQSMKLSHTAKPHNKDDIAREDLDPADLQPFPTLQRCLEVVDSHCGFNIEIKYPQLLKNGIHEMDNYFNLNEFIDTILHIVFQHHNGRRIVFSSFDCDACVALRLKQNRYPVLFLSQADTTSYVHYEDIRTQSIPMAAEFCLANGLLGVNAMSEVLLKDMTLIDYVKDSGLVLFCWGEDNNNKEMINLLKQIKIDAVIYDRIDCFKPHGKENIFKMEHAEKFNVLKDRQLKEELEPLTVILNGIPALSNGRVLSFGTAE